MRDLKPTSMGELRCQYCTDAKCQWDTHVYACFILCHITLMIVHFFGCIHCFLTLKNQLSWLRCHVRGGQVSAGHTCLCPVVCPLKTASSCGTDKNLPLMQVIKTTLLLATFILLFCSYPSTSIISEKILG